MTTYKLNLKPQLLKKVINPRSLLLTRYALLIEIPVFESLLQVLPHVHLLLRIRQILLIHNLLQVHVGHIPGREHVPRIHVADKRLHSPAALFNFFLGHATCDLPGAACNSRNEAVREATVAVAGGFVEGFNDHGFLARVATSEDNHNLSTFDYAHGVELESTRRGTLWLGRRVIFYGF